MFRRIASSLDNAARTYKLRQSSGCQNACTGLIQRSEQKDVDAPMQFEVERPFASHSLLTLVVCNGVVHVLPNPHPEQLRVVVHLGASLQHELTPRRFLQEFVVGDKAADVEWKLPASSRPVIDMYMPEHTALDLQLGNTNLLVKGVRGDKAVNAGKGTVRLDVSDGDSEYHSIIVDVAMGSFADLRIGNNLDHSNPLHQELPGRGDATAHLQMAMGKIEIAKENLRSNPRQSLRQTQLPRSPKIWQLMRLREGGSLRPLLSVSCRAFRVGRVSR